MRTTIPGLLVLAFAVAAIPVRAAQGDPELDAAGRAQVLAARRSWAEAIEAYKTAIAQRPRDAKLHNLLGICYQSAQDPRSARAEYKRAIELDEDYAEAYNNIGTLEHAHGRYKQAIAAYEKALQAKPQAPLVLKNLGAAWLARGNVEKALAAWNEAIRLDPAAMESGAMKVPAGNVSLADQYFLFAKVFAARGDLDKALDYLVKAQGAGFRDFAKVEKDQDFAGVVTSPRYAGLR